MAQFIESLDFPTTRGREVSPELSPEVSWVDAEVEVSVATYQAYQILYYAFVGMFLVAGVDKFLHLLTDWENYAAPSISNFLHISRGALTMSAGLVELCTAAAIALKPRIGSWMASVWLWLIAADLLAIPGHYEVVLSTLMLSAAAFAFTRLSAEIN